MKILLFGRNGQVAWELQRALAPLGELTVAGRERADFEAPSALAAIIAAERPELIVNAVAFTAVDKAETDADRAQTVNATAVEVLAGAAARHDACLIHYSTDYVFDGRKLGAYSEEDATGPKSVYGRSKLEGERAIARSGCVHLIIRTSWVHAGRGSNFIRTILRLAREREQLRIVADQTGAPTGAELIADVTALAVAAMARRQGALASGIYHLTAGGQTTWHDFARFIVAEAIERGAILKAGPDAIAPIPGSEYPVPAERPANSLLDTHRLRAGLGIALPDWTLHARRSISQLLEKV